VRDGKLVTDDQKLLPDDKIKLIAIVSGGTESQICPCVYGRTVETRHVASVLKDAQKYLCQP
jgi:hypothetical protein